MLSAEARFDRDSSACVPRINPGDEGILAFRLARQGLLPHLEDVARRQQFKPGLLGHPLFGNEQHRQHDHGDVMVP